MTAQPDYQFTDYANLRPDTPEDGLPLELTLGGDAGDVRDAAVAASNPDTEPDLAVTSAPTGSLADELAAEFGTFTVPTCTVPIPGRRGWALRFRLDWTEVQARERRSKSADPQAPDGISAEKLFRTTIIEQNVAILRLVGEDWQPVTGRSGRPLTFRDPELWPLLRHPATKAPARNATSAVGVLLPIFTQLSTVGIAISRAAGQEDLLDPSELD